VHIPLQITLETKQSDSQEDTNLLFLPQFPLFIYPSLSLKTHIYCIIQLLP
jgi:hypothetical protein